MTDVRPPTDYTPPVGETFSKDTTIFVGLVVHGILDISTLRKGANALIQKCPVLGGQVLRKKFPYSITTGSSLDFSARTVDQGLASYLPINIDVSGSNQDEPSFHQFDHNADKLFHFDSLKFTALPPPNVLAIRITVLHDATLLGFRMAHHLCDAESTFNIIKAFADLVSGRETPDLVLPSSDAHHHSQETITVGPTAFQPAEGTASPTADFSTGDALILTPPNSYRIDILAFIWWAICCIIHRFCEILCTPNRCHEKYIYVSENTVSRWKRNCQEELDGKYNATSAAIIDTENGSQTGLDVRNIGPIRLSSLDVLVAWNLKSLFINSLPEKSATPVMLMYPFSNLVTSDPQPSTSTTPKTINNSLTLRNSQYQMSVRFSSTQALQRLSHARIARSLRLAVTYNKTPAVLDAYHSFWRANQQSIIAYGPPGSRLGHLVVTSSWANLDFSSLDFRGAVLKGRRGEIVGNIKMEKQGVEEGMVIFTHPSVLGPLGIVPRPLGIIIKDVRTRGFWIRAGMDDRAWRGHGYLSS